MVSSLTEQSADPLAPPAGENGGVGWRPSAETVFPEAVAQRKVFPRRLVTSWGRHPCFVLWRVLFVLFPTTCVASLYKTEGLVSVWLSSRYNLIF